jgi:deazaflavin-dependent oxidoreductase (nitroreductase family)
MCCKVKVEGSGYSLSPDHCTVDGQALLRSGSAACSAAPRVRDAGFAGAGIDFLKLTTIGARTGQPRTAPLAYIRTGEAFVVAASNYGAPTAPSWYHNLVMNPRVQVELPERPRFAARARVTRGLERDLLYGQLADHMAGFLAAQRRTPRQIPIVVLERERWRPRERHASDPEVGGSSSRRPTRADSYA